VGILGLPPELLTNSLDSLAPEGAELLEREIRKSPHVQGYCLKAANRHASSMIARRLVFKIP
jgi:hypothetical protein